MVNINKQKLTPYALIAPVLIFMIVTYGYPLILTFKYSFQQVSLIGSNNTFVGLENYKNVLLDSKLYGTLILTFKWTILTVFLKMCIGFIMAMFLNGKIYLKKTLTFLMLIPWAIPQVVVGILWSWILNGDYGYLNYYLQEIGIANKVIPWLSEPTLAFISTSFVDAWIGIPFITMMFLSGLGSIDDSLYEAAKVDGANSIQRFIYITLPGMKKVILIALTLTTIWTFNTFNVIYVLTSGGPMGATETMMIKIYNENFGKYNLGVGATLSVIVFVILTILSMFYWKQISRDE
ncbi:carbohydrate ABC transporter permease [Clostridium cylindrosporum]|uniref:ABC-type sugar transport system, permease component n=1 Tax=Clostridium cylindrosporum DSM 605 TaxID=1121307 RepID=A0A0J8DCZ9_CLOCY|nr:sugar ABC transporter permease [Clostridium cylindrosporum]KMT22134.1 ABC-type sugar transport system, permease component [Clostridium cylindrosporum DSM 605]